MKKETDDVRLDWAAGILFPCSSSDLTQGNLHDEGQQDEYTTHELRRVASHGHDAV